MLVSVMKTFFLSAFGVLLVWTAILPRTRLPAATVDLGWALISVDLRLLPIME
jgi:hypothetical protein